jgi:ABC-type oligopeptide transport system substrate-binding subunit
MRRLLTLISIALAAGLLPSAAARGLDAAESIREGGTFRVAFLAAEFDHIDPALAYSNSLVLLDITCATLMRYPDKPPPAGFQLAPEVAAAFPRVSRDGKTYTFTLRTDFRFSDGTPLQASAFARAIQRTLAPGINSPGAQYTKDIVGAKAFRSGRATTITGVLASDNRLVIRFTRPVPDFAAQTTMAFFCAVPPTLPADPEGVGAFPAAGPYYVAEYRPGQRVLLRRNPFYRGRRPHHVDSFVADFEASSPEEVVDRIERGEVDWGSAPRPAFFDPEQKLVAKYGVNRSRFFVRQGLLFRGYALNTSRPLFRNNPGLRRAVNFAIDRSAHRRVAGGVRASRLTDQYLPPNLPGFVDARIYPLHGPDLRRARALARGRTRSGKAVLYTFDLPFALAAAQIVKQNLARIGLDVQVTGIPQGAYARRIDAADYDIAFNPWFPDYLDPYSYVNLFFDSRFIGATNWARFDSARYNQLIRRAARLQGGARYRTYGRLDVQLARDAAPIVATDYVNEPTLVSKRVGCVILRPSVLLTAICLK